MLVTKMCLTTQKLINMCFDEEGKGVGADDLLPMIVYVVSQTKEIHLWTNVAIINDFGSALIDSGKYDIVHGRILF
eukprot:m.23903 g.23903  ORF g.23903 m.23903 type:complete len:76 (+) comp5592_c0_seq3:212-439(+)